MKEASIFKAVQNQQRMICHQVCACIKALKEPIIVQDSDDNVLQEWSAKNPDLMYLVEFSGNKPSYIPGPIHTPGAAINQVGSPSIGPNNANTGRSGGENAVVVDSAIGNEGIGKSNADTKVGSEIPLNSAITAKIWRCMDRKMYNIILASPKALLGPRSWF